jgi:ATP-dependent DNA ligase
VKTLHKQTNTGKIQQWRTWTVGRVIYTEYGLVNGKLQLDMDEVRAGKNLGRSNETTPEQQAILQAQQEYDAKLKKGYVEDIKQAQATKNNLQGVEPMLAHPIEKKLKYAVFPALAQPKLDGLRCLAVIKNGECCLFSRTQKPIETVPHIVAELEILFADEDIILDGELYNHKFKDDFNQITHLAKRADVHEDSTQIEYHVYDVVGPGGYRERTIKLEVLQEEGAHFCKQVETIVVHTMEELEVYQAACVELGYEGCMYRNPDGKYEHKRSSNLLKVKTFQDAEFKIVGAEEGSGRLQGALGAFVLLTSSGETFNAKPACTFNQSVAYWNNRAKFIGKFGTVKFQNWTPDGLPRFPIFKCVRED